MTVFCDDMFKYPMGRYRGMKMSHMVGDTEAELHEMARKIGVSRRHYQGDHYDICFSKRQLAVSLGAVETTVRELARMTKARRGGRRGSTTVVEPFLDPSDVRKGPTGAGVPRRRLSGLETSGEG